MCTPRLDDNNYFDCDILDADDNAQDDDDDDDDEHNAQDDDDDNTQEGSDDDRVAYWDRCGSGHLPFAQGHHECV